MRIVRGRGLGLIPKYVDLSIVICIYNFIYMSFLYLYLYLFGFLHPSINPKVEEIVRIAGERGILSVLDMHQDVFNRFKYYLNHMDMHQDVVSIGLMQFKLEASQCKKHHLKLEFRWTCIKMSSKVWCNQVEGLGSPAYRMNIQNYSPGSTVATGSPTGQPTLRRKTSHILLRLSSLFSINFQFLSMQFHSLLGFYFLQKR